MHPQAAAANRLTDQHEGFPLDTVTRTSLDAVCRTAADLLGTPMAFVGLLRAGDLDLVGRCGIDGAVLDGGGAIWEQVLRADAVVVVPDVSADARCSADPFGGGPHPARFMATLALALPGDAPPGVIGVMDVRPRSDLGAERTERLRDLRLIVQTILTPALCRRGDGVDPERLRAQALLERSDAALRRAGRAQAFAERAAAFGEWRIDPARRTVGWSDGVARILGRASPEAGLSIEDYVAVYHPDDRDGVLEWIEASLAGRVSPAPFQTRARILLPDGDMRHVIVQGARETGTGGLPSALHGVLLDVTDLALVERQARETDRLLRDTIERMDQGLVVLDPVQRVRAVNRCASDLLDLPATVLHEGAAFSDIRAYQRARGDFTEVPSGLRSTMEGTHVRRLPPVYDWPLPSGITLEVRRSTLADGGSVTTFGDVTQHRLAERAVQESERRYRLLAENSTDIIIWSDLTTRRRYVSPAVSAVLGYVPDDLVGTRPLDFTHPEDVDAYRRVLDDLTEGRAARALTCQRYRHRDGHWVWLEISFSLTHDLSSGAADGYVASLRDVTERRKMEDALRESDERYRALADARLQEAQARADFTAAASAAILAQLAEGVIVTDIDGRITLVNTAAAQIHGVARLDVEPDSYSDTYHLFQEDGRPHPPQDLPLARAVRGETVRDARWRVRRPGGSEVLAIGSAQPLRALDGTQIGAVLTLRDDTARDAAERSLRDSETRLRDLNATLAERVSERTREAEAARALAEEASRAKSEFLASMSHEIRTPLNGVLGYADLLLDEPNILPAIRQYGERIRSAGAALLTVVNDILDFSKIEAGQIEIAARPFALGALIDNTVSIVRGLADAKRLGLHVVIAPDLPIWLSGDEDRVRQVLLNLLNNAIKFTAEGRIDLWVGRDNGGSGDEAGPIPVRFAVADTGIGVPAAKQDRLFQRFSQVDGTIQREYGGTGLGLAISKRLVELMGGEIGFDGATARGSIFWFRIGFPLAHAREMPVSSVGAGAARAGKRLLLAEDVALNQELACAILRQAGHQVDVVENGADAVRAVQATRYDLVLMDVQMPGMDGMTATRHIRALGPKHADLPIIALTANVLPQQVAEFLSAGMNAHVGKPFKRDTLLAMIASHAAHTAEPPGDRPQTVDRAIFDEMADIVGREQMRGLLQKLAEELDARFIGMTAVPARDRVERDAHVMSSATGMLGFTRLSQLCSEVETMCRTGQDVAPLLGPLQVLTRDTIAEIALLRME